MNIAAQPPVQADQTVYLKDYQKPAFLVESINLDIQVYDDKTIVDSTLVMKRQTSGDLVLLGRDLELQSIQLNGQDLLLHNIHSIVNNWWSLMHQMKSFYKLK